MNIYLLIYFISQFSLIIFIFHWSFAFLEMFYTFFITNMHKIGCLNFLIFLLIYFSKNSYFLLGNMFFTIGIYSFYTVIHFLSFLYNGDINFVFSFNFFKINDFNSFIVLFLVIFFYRFYFFTIFSDVYICSKKILFTYKKPYSPTF